MIDKNYPKEGNKIIFYHFYIFRKQKKLFYTFGQLFIK